MKHLLIALIFCLALAMDAEAGDITGEYAKQQQMELRYKELMHAKRFIDLIQKRSPCFKAGIYDKWGWDGTGKLAYAADKAMKDGTLRGDEASLVVECWGINKMEAVLDSHKAEANAVSHSLDMAREITKQACNGG